MDLFGNIVIDKKQSDPDNFAGEHCRRKKNHPQREYSAHLRDDVVNFFIPFVQMRNRATPLNIPTKRSRMLV